MFRNQESPFSAKGLLVLVLVSVGILPGLEKEAKNTKPDNCDRDAADIQAMVIVEKREFNQNNSAGLEEKKREICKIVHNSLSVVVVSFNKNYGSE